jgi:arylsulfatase A-like enzyme/thioredoxin-like negative regulator of GroEL
MLWLAVWLSCSLVACGDYAPETQTTSTPRGTGPGTRPSEAPAPKREGPPNIVIITMDTTRADALGIYGQARPTSPQIDRIGRDGVVFDSAVTASPETFPSHATIFTGNYPFEHRVRSNVGYQLDDQNVTLAERLRAHGYRTGAEVASSVLQKSTRIDQGFDHFRGVESGGVELKKRGVKGDAGHEEASLVRTGSDITKRGIEFLRTHRSDRFFLWLHYFEPHSPYLAPLEYQAKIPDSPYHAEVASLDEEIGKIVRELERLELVGETLVVLTSDHGEGLYEHNEPTHSFLVYDTTIRIPLIFWGWKNLPHGKRIGSLVRTVDILPTILDLLDLQSPGDIHGISLKPLILGETSDLALTAYGEATSFVRTFGVSPIRFLREGSWKYIHKANPELYDLATDPNELNNVASENSEIVERLREILVAAVAGASPFAAETIEVDEVEAMQLQALGYVTIANASTAAISDDAASLSIDGKDANELMDDVLTVSVASGMLAAGRFEDALAKLDTLRRREPENDYVQSIVHRSLIATRRFKEALPVLDGALHRAPANHELRLSYADALVESGNTSAAIDVLRDGVRESPCTMSHHTRLDVLLRAEKRYAELVSVLESAVRECPEEVGLLNNYAWALATLPDAGLRDGEAAERIITGAIEQVGHEDPSHLDTLAAAIAEQGRYAEAVGVQQRAVDALDGAGFPEEVKAIVRDHLTTYRGGRPVRDPLPDP